jgi:hypothetical protein
LFGTLLPIWSSPTRDFRGAAAVVGSTTSVMTQRPMSRKNFQSRQPAPLSMNHQTRLTSAGLRITNRTTCLALARTCALQDRHHLPPVAAADDFAGENECLKADLGPRCSNDSSRSYTVRSRSFQPTNSLFTAGVKRNEVFPYGFHCPTPGRANFLREGASCLDCLLDVSVVYAFDAGVHPHSRRFWRFAAFDQCVEIAGRDPIVAGL